MTLNNIPVLVAVLLTAFFTPLLVSAQPQTGLFWGVTQKGSTDTSYLLGTIHQFPEEVIEIPKTVSCRVLKSQGLFIETNLDFKMGLKSLLRGQFFDDPALPEDVLVTEENLTQVKNWFIQVQGMREEDYNQINSSGFLRLTPLFIESYGFKLTSMEFLLKNKAAEKQVPVKGLDKNLKEIQSWYAWYQNLAIYTRQKFPDMPSYLENFGDDYADLIIAYALQDTSSIIKEISEQEWKNGLTLVEYRNLNWMKKLPEIMTSRNFVAVGAAHLFGKNGLIQLLKNKGFELIPIPCDFTGKKLQKHIMRNGKNYQLLQQE